MPAKKYSGKLSAEKCAEKCTVLRKDARRSEKRLKCSAKMRGVQKRDYSAPQKCAVLRKDVQGSAKICSAPQKCKVFSKMCSAQKNVQIAEMQDKKYI